MQLELKKQELESYLLTISAINPDTGKMVSGLLNENLKLGSKRKLQKLHKQLLFSYKEFIEELNQVKKECGEDQERLKSEGTELFNEMIKLDIDPVNLIEIEGISSSTNYNFEIIEKFAI